MYINFVCIRNCNIGQRDFSNYKDPTAIYKYKIGEVYNYYYSTTSKFTNNGIYFNNKYHGSLSSAFVDTYFITMAEYETELSYVDDLFDDFLII
jgi:hypothetical protein